MAYNTEKLTRLAALKTLAERIKNDYATKEEVRQEVASAKETLQAAIQTAIAQTGHARFEKVEALPEAAEAEENVLYLLLNSKTKHYDIYAKIGDKLELLDDMSVDLTGYVQKEDGKGLSANDYSDTEKQKLAGVAEGATKTEVGETNGTLLINGEEVTVYQEPSDLLRGEIATKAEIAEMLSEVFGSGESSEDAA